MLFHIHSERKKATYHRLYVDPVNNSKLSKKIKFIDFENKISDKKSETFVFVLLNFYSAEMPPQKALRVYLAVQFSPVSVGCGAERRGQEIVNETSSSGASSLN